MRLVPLALFSALLVTRAASAGTDESPTAWGPSGLLHTPSAMATAPGILRGGLFLEGYSTSNWLCTRANPCAAGATSDRHRHTGAIASLAYTLARGLELYLTSRAYVNDSTQSAQLLEVLGETTIGARWARPLRSGLFNVGGGADVVVGSGPGDVGLSFRGTSLRARALSTLALDALKRPLPFRVHFALSYTFDNSALLVRSVEHDRGQEVSRVERQGLGIGRVDRLEPSLGAEWLGFDGALRPFVELGLVLPIDRQTYGCPGDRAEAEGCSGVFPSKLTLGARAFPIAREGNSVAVLGALDLGLGGTRAFSAQLTPQAPWTLWLGLSMSTSTMEWGPKVMVDRVEVIVAPPTVALRGFVHPAGKTTPIPQAIVRYAGDVRPPLSTDQKGMFGDDVPPGSYELEVRAPGYRPAICGGLAIASKGAGSALELDCPLEPMPPPAPEPSLDKPNSAE